MANVKKLQCLLVTALLVVTHITTAYGEPKRPTDTLNVDERYQYQLFTSVPQSCVSVDFSNEVQHFLVLFSRTDLEAVVAQPREGYGAPLANIHRAELALASLSDQKDDLGCQQVTFQSDADKSDSEYLALNMIEEEKAAIYDKKTAKFEPTATVHYSSGSCCFGMTEIATPSDPFLFVLPWWIS